MEEASVPAAWGRFDELMVRIAACRDDEQTYWLGSDVSSRDCLGSSDAMVASTDVTHGYLIWAALTDRCQGRLKCGPFAPVEKWATCF